MTTGLEAAGHANDNGDTTRDIRGYESQLATNHLGHFQLTMGLWNPLIRARVVTLSSLGHRFSPINFEDLDLLKRAYDPWQAYGQSKTGNSLFGVLSPKPRNF